MSELPQHPTYSKGFLVRLEDALNFYLVKKAPALPEGVKGFIINAAALFLIFLILFEIWSIITLLFVYALTGTRGVGHNTPDILVFIVFIVIQISALPTLYKRKKQGWNMVFYNSLIIATMVFLPLTSKFFAFGIVPLVNLILMWNFYGSLPQISFNLLALPLPLFLLARVLSLCLFLYFLFQVREHYK